EDVQPVDASEYRYLGKSRQLDHLTEILDGSYQYGIDHKQENMLYASLERAPVVGGRIVAFDAEAALSMSGVVDVFTIDGSGLAETNFWRDAVVVVATSHWIAQQARKELQITWNHGLHASLSNSTIAHLAEQGLAGEPKIFEKAGDTEMAFEEADMVLEEVYETPYWSHSPLEPMNAIADVRQKECTIWAPCHDQSRLLDALVKVSGFNAEDIRICTTPMGGSFGRRLLVDYGIEAFLISRKVRQPVQMLNTRIDETKMGYYMPGGHYKLKGSIKNGQVTALELAVAHPSIWAFSDPTYLENHGGIDTAISHDFLRFPYHFPNRNYAHAILQDLPVPISWWRGTFGNTASFVLESAVDELAHMAETDPIEFRLKLLQGHNQFHYVETRFGEEQIDRHLYIRMLERAREWSRWHVPLSRNRGRGIATTFTFFESYAIVVATVRVARKKVHIERIQCLVECGFVVNPIMVEAQIEGAIVFALSAMKKSAIHFENGRVQENSFIDYPIETYKECPEIDIEIMPSLRPSCGVGELANAPTFAAVTNAIFDACGIRIRSLPLSEHFVVEG
nr:molybdopterin-dependent oxidoreductase [Saprospiraceae bacterium]